ISAFADLPIDRVDAGRPHLQQDFARPRRRDRKLSELHNLARAERVDPDDIHHGHETLLGFASIEQAAGLLITEQHHPSRWRSRSTQRSDWWSRPHSRNSGY